MKKIIVLLMLVFIGASTTIYAQESKSESRRAERKAQRDAGTLIPMFAFKVVAVYRIDEGQLHTRLAPEVGAEMHTSDTDLACFPFLPLARIDG